ncbi:MAG: MerR family transcriptional regulator, partial [Clostridiales bacterium]|nr:MerR family transcriptional regulator [Clostridiales bacterium]
MDYTSHELSRLAGVSTRTLRYYDRIGLLAPCRISDAGYRMYDRDKADILWQILFYRRLGLPLAQIKELL